MKAKKSLGQHFLKSERALLTMVETSNVSADDTVLEIGPGTGTLTEKLLATHCRLIAVEKDDELCALLKQKFQKEIASGQLTLINDDILKFIENSKLKIENYKLIANIPYNITGAVFKKFLETTHQPKTMTLLVQKEVAERIVARNNKESILSISVKAYGTPRYVERVLAGSFAPMPQVDSAIIAVENISKEFFGDFSEKEFFQMLKEGFKSKRKKLSSNLATKFDKNRVQNAFQELNLNENLRAEDVDIKTWAKLAENLSNRG